MLAGTVAAVVFATANLPMVWKALRTHDVGSYSLGSIVMINGANAVYSVYVFSLPFGPIWLLHSFYLVASAIMLVLCVREYRGRGGVRIPASPASSAAPAPAPAPGMPRRRVPARPAAASDRPPRGRGTPVPHPARPAQRATATISG
ncbi:hypothetical protein GCM10017608_24910 [Agromyces luteolus]|nr:hypothetical protein GCM10017608_24910 [Agromyces luteolus]